MLIHVSLSCLSFGLDPLLGQRLCFHYNFPPQQLYSTTSSRYSIGFNVTTSCPLVPQTIVVDDSLWPSVTPPSLAPPASLPRLEEPLPHPDFVLTLNNRLLSHCCPSFMIYFDLPPTTISLTTN
ncbi:hypothetical protein C8F04DRAFT_295955 [Mycena alexandri]|uniref:Uncharacterized protein n=1 Tax=Mycena alexandri TaxID=1745969 RepID=A0AAD6T4F7_9AGAR|nr:hypothetical protein C8F04DRAFT_295955 [Mycena alexandri]